MRGVVDKKLRRQAITLRDNQRLSLREISKAIGVPKGTLSSWLKGHQLSDSERKARASESPRYATPKKDRGQPSAAYLALNGRSPNPAKKSEISEAATLFRLVLHGFHVMSPLFDCAKTDWLVEVPETGKLLRVQVKWAAPLKHHGLPTIRLTCTEGHSEKRKYRVGEFDFIVGYDLFTDTAYVYSFSEVSHLETSVTIRPDAAERWDKLRAG